MSNLINRILLKARRSFGSQKLLKIKKGVLKGVKWSVAVPDNRYILGVYEEDLGLRIKKAVSEGKRFVDIGANAGYFSLLASNFGSDSVRHLAVEPFPENVALLKKHLTVNNMQNVEVKELAVSDRTGELEFSNSGNLAANTYKSESSIFTDQLIKVKTTSLDALADHKGLDGNCFLKIDVEGAEFDVLRGGKKYLTTHHPDVVLATHDNHVKGVKKDCLDFMTEIGYQINVLDDIKIDGQEDFLCTYPRES